MPMTPSPSPSSTIASDPPGLTWADIAHRPLYYDGEAKNWESSRTETWPIYARDPCRSDRGPKRWREHVVLTADQVGVLQIVRNNLPDGDERKKWTTLCASKWPLNFHANGKAFKMQPVMPEGWAEKWKAVEAKARETMTEWERAKGEEIIKMMELELGGPREIGVKEMGNLTKENDELVDGGKRLIVKLSLTDTAGQNTDSDGIEHAARSVGSASQAQMAVPSVEPSSKKDNAQATAPRASNAVQQRTDVQKNTKTTDTLKRKREDWRIDDAAHKRFLSDVRGKIARLKTYNDAKKSRPNLRELADLEAKTKNDAKRIQELETSVKEHFMCVRELEHQKDVTCTSLRQLQEEYKDTQSKCQLMDSVCREKNTKIQLLEAEIDRLQAANAGHILESKRLANELESKDLTTRGDQSLLQELSAQRSELTDKLNAAEKREERLEQTLYMMTTTLLDFAQDDQASAAGSGNDYDTLQSGLRQLLEQICPQDVRERV